MRITETHAWKQVRHFIKTKFSPATQSQNCAEGPPEWQARRLVTQRCGRCQDLGGVKNAAGEWTRCTCQAAAKFDPEYESLTLRAQLLKDDCWPLVTMLDRQLEQ